MVFRVVIRMHLKNKNIQSHSLECELPLLMLLLNLQLGLARRSSDLQAHDYDVLIRHHPS